MGVDVDYFLIRDMQMESGDFFYPSEVENGAKVCVLGKTVADNLFVGEDPVGKIMRIRNIPFTVKGVLRSKGQSTSGNDQDDIVLAPHSTTSTRLIGARWRFLTIIVSAVSQERIPIVQEDISNLMQGRHSGTTAADFMVSSQTDVAEAASSVSNTMTVLLASIAGSRCSWAGSAS
jgi:putative ABC transport system permease protein